MSFSHSSSSISPRESTLGTIDHQWSEMVQLATRIPRSLHNRVRRFCVEHDMLLQDFVGDAIAEGMQAGMRADTKPPRRRPPKRPGIDWRQQFGHIETVPTGDRACPLCGRRSSLSAGETLDMGCEHDVGWLVDTGA